MWVMVASTGRGTGIGWGDEDMGGEEDPN